jgi:hypothetical protein
VTWREDLRRVVIGGRSLIGASFRGVPFFVGESERAGGRRAVGHEFPFRDDPFVRGPRPPAREFRIDGYVLGDDYLTQRDALLAALEDESGPGRAGAPVLRREARDLHDCSVKESREQGRHRDVLDRVRRDADPGAGADRGGRRHPSDVAAGADAAIARPRPSSSSSTTSRDCPRSRSRPQRPRSRTQPQRCKSKLAGVVSDTQELAALAGQVEIITAEAAALVRDPAEAIEAFRAAITGLVKTAAAAPGALMDALFDAYIADLGPEVADHGDARARARKPDRARPERCGG